MNDKNFEAQFADAFLSPDDDVARLKAAALKDSLRMYRQAMLSKIQDEKSLVLEYVQSLNGGGPSISALRAKAAQERILVYLQQVEQIHGMTERVNDRLRGMVRMNSFGSKH